MTQHEATPYGIAVVNKALDVLEALQDADELPLQEICRRTGLPKSSAFRLLSTLEGRGYVERGADEKRYRLTFQVVEMGRRLLGQNPVRRLAMPHMHSLSERFGETVNLAVLHGTDVVYIDTLESRFPFRVTETPGSRSPVYATALGKALTAHLPEPERARLLDQISFLPLTAQTITDRAQFEAALGEVLRRGYALDHEEAEAGVRAIAAPILGMCDHPVAAISICGPAVRFPAAQEEAVAGAVIEACQVISRQCAHLRQPPFHSVHR